MLKIAGMPDVNEDSILVSAKDVEHFFAKAQPHFENLVVRLVDVGCGKTSICSTLIASLAKEELNPGLLCVRHHYFREVAIQRFGDFFESVKNSPELIGKLAQFMSLKKGSFFSRRRFVVKYLAAIPEFRDLLEMAESEFSAAWRRLVGVIKRAVAWLWKGLLRLLKRNRRLPIFEFIANHFLCEKEKLWPLLMAFKNH